MVERAYLILPPCRLSFPNLGTPKFNELKQAEQYEATFLFKPGVSLAALEKLIQDTAKEYAWKDKKPPMAVTKKDLAPGSGYPLNDQEYKEGKYDGYEAGGLYFAVNSKRPIPVFIGNPNHPDFEKELERGDSRFDDYIYPGAWVRPRVSCYAYENKKSGVGINCSSMQWLKAGERLDSGGTDDPGVFDDAPLDDSFFKDDAAAHELP